MSISRTHRFKVGDRLLVGQGSREGWERYAGREITVTGLGMQGEPFYECEEIAGGIWDGWISGVAPIGDPDDSKPQDTAVTPAHYAFPGGIRVHQISGHLTSFGGQALQYIARSTRLDGQNKGDTAENLRKAIRFLKLEIARVEAAE